jgi:hypothetical protein
MPTASPVGSPNSPIFASCEAVQKIAAERDQAPAPTPAPAPAQNGTNGTNGVHVEDPRDQKVGDITRRNCYVLGKMGISQLRNPKLLTGNKTKKMRIVSITRKTFEFRRVKNEFGLMFHALPVGVGNPL